MTKKIPGTLLKFQVYAFLEHVLTKCRNHRGIFSADFVIILTQFLVNKFSHVTSQWETFFPQTDVSWHDTESGAEQAVGFYTFSKFLHGYPDLPSGSGSLSDLLKVPVWDYRWSYQLWEKVTNVKNVQFPHTLMVLQTLFVELRRGYITFNLQRSWVFRLEGWT